MNERIQLLAEQAGIKLPDSLAYNGHIYRNSIEKFAQLLEKDTQARHFSEGYTAGQSDGTIQAVKQCLLLCDQVDLAGADECIAAIQEHFGIEQ